MEKIKRVNMLSLAKILGVIYSCFGLLVGLFMSLAAILNIQLPNASQNPNPFGAAAIVVLPIIYGIIGFLSGYFSGFFFNLATKWVGGLEIEKE